MPNAAAAGTRESAFWQFSLAFYARPEVPAACLELQDSAGVDVNVLLYLLFLAGHRRQLDRADVARIDAAIRQWRELAVVPLRALRRQLKTGITPVPVADTEALRSAVKRVELDAERIEQEWLELHATPSSLGAPAASRTAAARANLAAYRTLLGDMPDAAAESLLASYGEHVA